MEQHPDLMKHSDEQIGGSHYKSMKIQPTDFIAANSIPFIEGNVIKYVCRHSFKNGKEDILKAIHYLNLLLEYKYPDESNDLQRPVQKGSSGCSCNADCDCLKEDTGREFCNYD